MEVYFGKYKGVKVNKIPSDYLKWLTVQDRSEEELAFRKTPDKHFY